MNRRNYITSIILLLIISSCGKSVENLHPEIMKPNWDDVKTQNRKLEIGNIISIKAENNTLYGIVMDYNEDEMGIWYGICFSMSKIEKAKINNSNFYGRKIPSGLVNISCIECFDLTYLNESEINENLNIIERIKLIRDNISIGSISSANNISEMERDFNFGKKQRLKKPTECNENVLCIKRIDERYMNLKDIIIE